MRRLVVAVAVLLAWAPVASAAGQFEGTLAFTEAGCQKKGKCILKHRFGYIDSTGVGWEARAGNSTDGASIPDRFQGWVGTPFDADLVRAAVIHDHYCDRQVRSTWDTHWVFYDALLASGVEASRARLMYGAVLVGGPKWIWVVEGEPCGTGQTCVQMHDRPSLLPEIRRQLGDGGREIQREAKTLLYRPARYGDPAFQLEMEAVRQQLAAPGGPTGRAEMEALVKRLRPGDVFLNGPDVIVKGRRTGAAVK